MKATLGAATVDAITKPAAAGPPQAATAALSTAKSVFDSFTSEESGPVSTLPPTAPPLVPAKGPRAPASPSRTARPGVVAAAPEQHVASEDSDGGGGGGHYVDVLLADRGTQTMTEGTTQTDPDPHVLTCGSCYGKYFGHPPPRIDGCAYSGLLLQGAPIPAAPSWAGAPTQQWPAGCYAPFAQPSWSPHAALWNTAPVQAAPAWRPPSDMLQSWLTRLETLKLSVDQSLRRFDDQVCKP